MAIGSPPRCGLDILHERGADVRPSLFGRGHVNGTSRAAVLEAPERLVMREFPLPSIGPDEGLLRIEMAGVCGTDWKYFSGALANAIPLILGHEILGRVAEIGERAAQRYGVAVGDRVLVEGSVPCWSCGRCRSGEYRFCERKNGYGIKTSSSTPPHIWGAMSEYMYLAPGSILHRISSAVPAGTAIAAALLANGIEWLRDRGNVTLGDDVVIQGCGPQGLAATVIAREVGARRVIVTGLARDAARLDLARRLGATDVIVADQADVVARVAEITNGRLADVCLDVSGSAVATPISIRLVRKLGTVVLGGLAGRDAIAAMPMDHIVWNEIRIQGVYVKGEAAYAKAIDFIETRAAEYPVDEIVSHTFPLDRAEDAIRAAAGQHMPPGFVKAAIVP
jgi:alcohol dehydrogenase